MVRGGGKLPAGNRDTVLKHTDVSLADAFTGKPPQKDPKPPCGGFIKRRPGDCRSGHTRSRKNGPLYCCTTLRRGGVAGREVKRSSLEDDQRIQDLRHFRTPLR